MNPSKPFLWFAIFSCVVTVGALLMCTSNHVESHDRIINHNQTAFQSYQEMLASIPSRIDALNVRKQEIILDIVQDSILTKLPKLPTKQQQALASYVESAVMAASMEMSYINLVDELEASVSSVQIANINAEIKDLLELEFNKIQNEYQTLALWAGILTIVFLIFSFYSMFKTEELLKQGHTGVKELSDLKVQGTGQISDLISTGRSIIDDFETKSAKAIRAASEKAIIKKNELTKDIKGVIEVAMRDITDAADNASRSLDQKYMDLSEALKIREEADEKKCRQLMAEDRKLIDVELKTIKMQLDYIEQKIKG